MALNQTNKLVWIVEAHLSQVEVEYLRHLWLVDRMRKDSSLFNKDNQ